MVSSSVYHLLCLSAEGEGLGVMLYTAQTSVCGTTGRDEVEGRIERGFSRWVLEKEQERGGMSLARGG